MDYSREMGYRSQAASQIGVNVRWATALDWIQHELDYFAVELFIHHFKMKQVAKTKQFKVCV